MIPHGWSAIKAMFAPLADCGQLYLHDLHNQGVKVAEHPSHLFGQMRDAAVSHKVLGAVTTLPPTAIGLAYALMGVWAMIVIFGIIRTLLRVWRVLRTKQDSPPADPATSALTPLGDSFRRKAVLAGLKFEPRCKEILESIFQKPFIKIRPVWLTNPKTGRALELDLFCAALSLAVEYDGAQHAKFTAFFHKDEGAFQDQLQRDRVKEKLCKKYGITLIRVPATVKYVDLEPFLRQELLRVGLLPPVTRAHESFPSFVFG
jgi:hypothetical protein